MRRKNKLAKSSAQKNNFDKKLVFSLNQSKIPNWSQLKYVSQFLNKREKNIINIGILVILVSLAFLGTRLYIYHIKPVPAFGGIYTENLTGKPQFINPLYSSINTADSDIASLIYSGLLKKDANSQLVPDLAENFKISKDELVYTFNLKKDVRWHDGEHFNSDDVIFTYQAIGNNEYKSPLKISFDGVRIQKIDEYSVEFSLNEPYAAFLELLTTGIMPAHLWQQIPPNAAHLADSNLKPIGTGPYKFKSLTKDKKTGVIHAYTLEANKNYHNDQPHISEIIFRFSPNFLEGIKALNEGRVEGLDYLPKEYKKDIVSVNSYQFHYLEQPQLTALFFNLAREGVLSKKEIRQALAYALNKEQLIAEDERNFIQIINNSILPIFSDYQNNEIETYSYNPEKAKELLDKEGWKTVEVVPAPAAAEADQTSEDNETAPAAEVAQAPEQEIIPGTWRKKGNDLLKIIITTVDQADSLAVAEKIKTAWEVINVQVEVNMVNAEDIQNQTIKSRDYDILLFGIILGADPDQYAFWHSSQIGANGLNLSNYNNKKIDELLEDGRVTSNLELRYEKYNEFQKIISQDVPAIFLLSQKYPYLQTSRVKGFGIQSIIVPADRFNDVTNWYIKTKKQFVW